MVTNCSIRFYILPHGTLARLKTNNLTRIRFQRKFYYSMAIMYVILCDVSVIYPLLAVDSCAKDTKIAAKLYIVKIFFSFWCKLNMIRI